MKASFIDCIFLILPEMVKKNVLDWPWPVEFRSLVLLYMLFSWSENLYFSHASSLWSVWLNPLSPSILSLCVDLRKSFSIFLYLFFLMPFECFSMRMCIILDLWGVPKIEHWGWVSWEVGIDIRTHYVPNR